MPATVDDVLAATSRTFAIPISRLPDGLREAVGSAYLCMRAIDEIEDHPALPGPAKAELLRGIGRLLQAPFTGPELVALFRGYAGELPPVTVRLGEWIAVAPADVAPRVCDATAAMADRMADWVGRGWRVDTEGDLDRYTFGVAGAVGLLLAELWAWHDGTASDRAGAVAFGRGLQAVNILRNRAQDLERGADFYPPGWTDADLHGYARHRLAVADRYLAALPPGPAARFCAVPLALAHATLDVLSTGAAKLDRAAVHTIVERATHAVGA